MHSSHLSHLCQVLRSRWPESRQDNTLPQVSLLSHILSGLHTGPLHRPQSRPHTHRSYRALGSISHCWSRHGHFLYSYLCPLLSTQQRNVNFHQDGYPRHNSHVLTIGIWLCTLGRHDGTFTYCPVEGAYTAQTVSQNDLYEYL